LGRFFFSVLSVLRGAGFGFGTGSGLGATGRLAAGSFLPFHDYIALILRAILLQEVRAPHLCLVSGKTLRKNVKPSLFLQVGQIICGPYPLGW
jgi:hypothetical protein